MVSQLLGLTEFWDKRLKNVGDTSRSPFKPHIDMFFWKFIDNFLIESPPTYADLQFKVNQAQNDETGQITIFHKPRFP